MARLLQVECRSCGTWGSQTDGAIMAGDYPRCVKCGRDRLVPWEEMHAARLAEPDPEDAEAWEQAKITELAGRCRCGGHFTVTADIRCRKCRSTDVEIVEIGHAD